MARLKRTLLLLLLLLPVLVAGCDDGGEQNAERGAPKPQAERLPEHTRGEALLIRKWLFALNAEDYTLAASYFARGAVIDQGAPIRLRDAEAARRFNAALPCQADLVGIEDEPGPKTLASFRLRAGPGGPCSGIARVRFTIRKGRFTEWRQLPGRPDPSGPVVLLRRLVVSPDRHVRPVGAGRADQGPSPVGDRPHPRRRLVVPVHPQADVRAGVGGSFPGGQRAV